MVDPKERNWWERNVEDAWEDRAKHEHDLLEEYSGGMQLISDISYGMGRGTYNFTKGLAVGLVDLSIYYVKLNTFDPELYGKIWDVTKSIGKAVYISHFGTREQRLDQDARIIDATKSMGSQVKDDLVKEWEKASKEGREAALISRWATEGVLNIASFFVGTGEVKAAAGAAKAAEALEAAEVATVIIKCPKVLAAEQLAKELKVAEEAEAAEETARLVKEAAILDDAAKVAAKKADGIAENAAKTSGNPDAKSTQLFKSLRERYLGGTPGKYTKQGREVRERMRKEGTLKTDPQTGKDIFKAENEKWYPVDSAKIHMGHHPVDAVDYWNNTGRYLGERSPAVRSWMLDSNNYRFEYGPLNSARGGATSSRYLPPVN
jgi:hypothetical protein